MTHAGKTFHRSSTAPTLAGLADAASSTLGQTPSSEEDQRNSTKRVIATLEQLLAELILFRKRQWCGAAQGRARTVINHPIQN